MTTSDELKTAGYVLIDGEWYAPNSARARAYRFARDTGQAPKLERHPGNGVLGALQIQRTIGERFIVRIKSFRKRLLDEDNLCEKFHIDLCRYAGIIPTDAPGTTKIEVSQEKVGQKDPERVVIEVYRYNP